MFADRGMFYSLPLRGRWQTERRESLDCLTDEESPQGICNTLFPVGVFGK